MSDFFRKIKGSIFTKLLLVIIMTGVLAIFSNIGILRFFAHQFFSPFRKNMIHYANFIIQEIGVPPDKVKALEIAKDLSICIRFESSSVKWTTDDNLLSFEGFDKMASDEDEQIRTEFDEGVYYIALQQDSGRYLFAYDLKKSVHSREVLAILLIVALSLIFAGAYLLIRRILKPIKWLTEGVEQVSQGNLSYQVQESKCRSDELGKLTESFNAMTKRIHEMIRSKEQLLLDVSHELRSPLTRVKVALELLPDDQGKKSIAEDVSEVEMMINEILETQRLNSNHGRLCLGKANVSEILEEVALHFQNKAPGVVLAPAAERVLLNIDSERIKTVLKNILENAVKYSKPESQPIEIRVTSGEKSVVIGIKDYGSGISQEEIPFIFEPFYRVDKSRSKLTGGYGLGMSLCKKIMEAHGGTIEIESDLNSGTTVYLRFKK